MWEITSLVSIYLTPFCTTNPLPLPPSCPGITPRTFGSLLPGSYSLGCLSPSRHFHCSRVIWTPKPSKTSVTTFREIVCPPLLSSDAAIFQTYLSYLVQMREERSYLWNTVPFHRPVVVPTSRPYSPPRPSESLPRPSFLPSFGLPNLNLSSVFDTRPYSVLLPYPRPRRPLFSPGSCPCVLPPVDDPYSSGTTSKPYRCHPWPPPSIVSVPLDDSSRLILPRRLRSLHRPH